jgi:hypothetical protein
LLWPYRSASLATHTHQDGQNETTCQVCQAAQHVAPIAVASTLATQTFITFDYVQPVGMQFRQEFFYQQSPSRAPPSDLL